MIILRKIFADPDIAIDLGTANTRLFASDKKHFYEEPSVVDYNIRTDNNQEIGVRVLPLRGGVIADVEAATSLLKSKFERMRRLGLLKPRVLACIPSDATEKERFSLIKAITRAGAASVYVVPEPLAAAVGSSIDISEPYAQMVVDIGDGVTDIAVIRSGELIHTTAVRKACSDLHQSIRGIVRDQYDLLISREDAEKVTQKIDALYEPNGLFMQLHGKHWPGYSEMSADVRIDVLCAAINPVINTILKTISVFVAHLPPDVAAEITEGGIFLTGGGAKLAGISARIESETGLKTTVVPDPLHAVIDGASIMLDIGAATNLWQAAVN